MAKLPPTLRQQYRYFLPITTRWQDNDVYQHVNNVVYYAYFDTVVNQYLLEKEVLEIGSGQIIGLVVESACRYFSPISFPERVLAGLRVGKLGTTSVRYEVGIFRDDQSEASAEGYFVHVYVDRATRRPVPLPQPLQAALLPLVVK
jgi:acyl-CoA thioester hydrolase